MQMLNRRDPRTDPWGTPHLMQTVLKAFFPPVCVIFAFKLASFRATLMRPLPERFFFEAESVFRNKN